MAPENRTKYLLARNLYKMLDKMPFTKVKVKDLCKQAGVSSQTFYYHFHDKYDLAAWVVMNDMRETFTGAPYDYDSILETLRLLAGREDYYRNVLTDYSQYNIGRYIKEATYELSTDAVKEHLGVPELPKETRALLRYHSYGQVEMFIDWICGRSELSIEEHARLQLERTPDILRDALNGYMPPSQKRHGQKD